MRITRDRVWIIFMMTMLVLTFDAVAGGYSGGAGTAANPYRIGTAADWMTLSATEGDWDKCFILTADIDFGGASLTPVGADDVTPFTGVLDGGGHVLSMCQINLPEKEFVGLFGYVGKGGVLKYLAVTEIAVTGAEEVGGLAGFNDNGTISSCSVMGAVTGSSDVGALLGNNWSGTVMSCYAGGMVTGATYIGGLMGYNTDGVVTSCFVNASVAGSDIYVGGLMGGNYGTILYCYATGDVSGDSDTNGGLVGFNLGTIRSCCAKNTVEGGNYVGGLVGSDRQGTVISCYATGTVEGSEYVGGLAGESWGSTITSCYAAGFVSGSDMAAWIGGLIGRNYHEPSTVTSCYWDKDATGQSHSAGGEGRTTDEMTYAYAENTYVDWDFTAVWKADTDYSVNYGYPYLRPKVPHPGDINGDFRMVLSEAIAYLAGWQHGNNPMAYAIRAAYLWQNGETYVYDGDSVPPMCWALVP